MTEGAALEHVLVLGAGSAHAYGFPLGRSLMFRVHGETTNLEVRQRLTAELARCGIRDDDALNQVNAISTDALRSGFGSIDRFALERPTLAPAIKILLCRVLREHERNSRLGRASEPYWYEYFWDWIAGRVKAAGPQVGVVTLNYDRSFAQFLLQSAEASFGWSREDALERGEACVSILHLHGSLGSLRERPYFDTHPDPWQEAREAALSIRMLGEDQTAKAYDDAVRLLVQAKAVCLLGTSFPAEVMSSLMNPKHWQHQGPDVRPRIFASVLGIAPAELHRIKTHFLHNVTAERRIFTHDGDCLGTLRHLDFLP